ncbi:glutactin-like [Ochlerotatus camptorhynchus]|uniref:glutactin-like n=1 Tax=Ochlerotatus camptorhynchus TaxID=644619 RepID=UPI0031DA4D1C
MSPLKRLPGVALLLLILSHDLESAVIVARQDSPAPLDTVVNINGLGLVRGGLGHTARTNQTIIQFYNIPYAEAPIGSRRFKAPVKANPWDDVRDVSAPGRECPQPVEGMNQVDENCLSLSVFTKNTTGNLPVMVYIHGGSLYLGAAVQHPPNYLMERDVILVVIQYRLGPLGFLSTLSEVIPGNAGMLDMIMALEWVQDHIVQFGGNPERVTVFGQSAGAAAISAMLYSPLVSQKLFSQVILQSGGSMATWAVDPNPVANAIDIAKYAGCNENAPLVQIEQCLMAVGVEDLVKALPLHAASQYTTSGMDNIGGCGLVIGGPSGFLQRKPLEYVRRGEVRRDVRMMGGVTQQDGSFVVNGIYDGLMAMKMINDSKFIQYDLLDMINRYTGLEDYSGALSAFEIEALFSADDLKSGNFTQMVNGLIDVAGAIVIKAPLLRDIQTNVRYSEEGTYLYSFDYVGEHTRFGYGDDTSHYPYGGGIHHSNDNIYLFPFPDFAAELNVADTKMSETMVDLWTSFAIDGVPKSKSVPDWKPVNSVVGPYMHINVPASMGQNFYREFSVTATAKSSAFGVDYTLLSLVSILAIVLQWN